ncbi:MAG: 60S ribosomal protein L26, partial [Promethearchaeota archaeon]
ECQIEKKDGSALYMPISPNNLIITKLGGKKLDPWREKILNRKEKDYGELLTEAPLKKKGGK